MPPTKHLLCYNESVRNTPLLLLFDGNAIVHRAFHAFGHREPLTVRRTGEIVSAVYGFATMLLKTINEQQPTHCAVAFDPPGPTFRHEKYTEYKAHRPPIPEDLKIQMGRVREMVKALDIPIYELPGYEADDALGTLSVQASKLGLETIIVTGDADILQLVTPQVRVLMPRPRGAFSDTMLYDEAAVYDKLEVNPPQVADFKGLKGDPSDNIPGVPGVGEKTAVKLISEFASVEGIYQRLEEVEPSKLREKLRENEDKARLSKELATIVTDVPLEFNPGDCHASRYQREPAVALFRELEFFSLIDKLPAAPSGETGSTPAAATEASRDTRLVNTAAALDALINRLSEVPAFSFDTETTGLDTLTAGLVGVSLSPAEGEAYYIPVGHSGEAAQLPLKEVIARLKKPFEDGQTEKYAHNAKFDMEILANYGVTVNNLAADSMISAHLLGEKSVGLKALALGRLGIEMTPISDLIGVGAKQITMAEVPVADACPYAGADAEITFRLTKLLLPELREQGLWSLFTEVEMPLVPILMSMERNGIALDGERLATLSRQFGEQIAALEKKIYEAAGHEFNINSSQQLAVVLFQEIGLPPTRRIRGGYTTGAAELEPLRETHPIIAPLLEYRQLSKLKSTYVDALPRLLNEQTGRLHTSFHQTRTATGRLSSSDPNLQNIPVRTGLGREVRQAFVAPPGTYLLAGDYSQIDLRALAHLSGDENLIAAFRRDEDIHAATASRLFGIPADAVTADQRRFAKTVNFGVIYGMSEYGLEQATELSRQEAAQFIKTYFDKYPQIVAYLEATRKLARERGYVATILGRRRYVPEVHSANRQVRESGERMAINMPVQGTSADIIKVAMINLERAMKKRNLGSRLLLQVHDELIFEVPENEMKPMTKLVGEVMSQAMLLSVPLKVDIKAGRNWEEMQPVS